MADPEVTESEPEPESMSNLTDLSKAETERADSEMLDFEESDQTDSRGVPRVSAELESSVIAEAERNMRVWEWDAASDQMDSDETEADMADSDYCDSEVVSKGMRIHTHTLPCRSETIQKRWRRSGHYRMKSSVEITKWRTGQNHPLPHRLPLYWIQRAASCNSGDDNITEPSFAIGQDVFLLSDDGAGGRRSTRKAHFTDDKDAEFEYRSVATLMYVVDELRPQRFWRVTDDGHEEEITVNWYFITPTPMANGVRGNRLFVTEKLLVAVEYRVGKFVKYNKGRVPGDSFGMRIALVEGAFVRDGERLYWLGGMWRRWLGLVKIRGW
jgi:hypothetical protein